MTRVFLAEYLNRLNLVNLPQFGEITYLAPDHINLWENETEDIILDLIEEKKFDSGVDFFALSGRMPIVATAMSLLVEQYGPIQCLLFDNKSQQYRLKTIGGLIK